MAHGAFPLWASTRVARRWSPCQALYAALLWDAWHCIRTSPKRQLRDEALRWFKGARAAISFRSVCEILGLDPIAVRRAIDDRGGDEDGALTVRLGTTARTRPLRHARYVVSTCYAPRRRRGH